MHDMFETSPLLTVWLVACIVCLMFQSIFRSDKENHDSSML